MKCFLIASTIFSFAFADDATAASACKFSQDNTDNQCVYAVNTGLGDVLLVANKCPAALPDHINATFCQNCNSTIWYGSPNETVGSGCTAVNAWVGAKTPLTMSPSTCAEGFTVTDTDVRATYNPVLTEDPCFAGLVGADGDADAGGADATDAVFA